ncbi:MAG: gamma-butyrobetaine hydroxylase-like domain-containing protein [Phycisphaerales bacterium]
MADAGHAADRLLDRIARAGAPICVGLDPVAEKLPAGRAAGGRTAVDAVVVGNYAIRIRFSDGHSTGIFSWSYLRSIDPGAGKATA